MADVIREYLVSLGYSVDAASEAKWGAALKRSADRIKAQSDVEQAYGKKGLAIAQSAVREHEELERRRALATENAARAISASLLTLIPVAGMVGRAAMQMTEQFTKLYFISHYSNQSVASLQALQDAFRKVGLEGQDALQAAEGLDKHLRTNIGAQGLVRAYGVNPNARGADAFVGIRNSLYQRFGGGPIGGVGYATAAQQAQQMGMSEDILRRIWNPEDVAEFRKSFDAGIKARADQEASAKEAATATDNWNKLLREASEIFRTGLIPVLQTFNESMKLLTNPDGSLKKFETGLIIAGASLLGLAGTIGAGRLLGSLLGLRGIAGAGVAGAGVGVAGGAAGGAAAGAAAGATGGGLWGALGVITRAFGIGAIAGGHGFQTPEEYRNDPANKPVADEANRRLQAIKDFLGISSKGDDSVRKIEEHTETTSRGIKDLIKTIYENSVLGHAMRGDSVLSQKWGGANSPLGQLFGFGAGGSRGDEGGPIGTTRIGKAAMSANALAVMDEFKKAGLPHEGVAALMGSVQTESTFNPTAHNNIGGGHTGLLQWDRNRWPKIVNWIKSQNGDPLDARWQARAAIAEGNAKPGDPLWDSTRTQQGWNMLRQSAGQMGRAMTGIREIERYGVGEEGGRGANANAWLPKVIGGPGAPSMMAGGLPEGLRVKPGASAGPHVSALGKVMQWAQDNIPGFNRVTALNDKYHLGTGSAHAAGLAADFTTDGASQVAFKALRDKMIQGGLTPGKDFKMINEYTNPSSRATGGHIHFQLTPEGAEKAGGMFDPSRFDATKTNMGMPRMVPAPTPGVSRNTNVEQNTNFSISALGSPDADMLAAGIMRRKRVLDEDLMRSLDSTTR
jgi:hypothetical protein